MQPCSVRDYWAATALNGNMEMDSDFEPKEAMRAVPIAYAVLVFISLVSGWSIPYFYEWTDSDQSRPSALLRIIPLTVLAMACVFCIALPWLPILRSNIAERTPQASRFTLRSLFWLITIAAIGVTLLAKFPIPVSAVVLACAALNVVRLLVQRPYLRWPTITLLACMILPFCWVIGYEERNRIIVSVLTMIATLPTLLPAAMIGAVFGVNLHDIGWIAWLLTAAEISIGTWVVGLGPKRAVAISLLVMFLSYFSSLAFYQLCVA